MIKLSNRLQEILKLIDNVNTLADIGCDHGKLLISALKDGKAKNGIGIDISKSSLEKAKNLAKEYFINNIEFFVGDGTLLIENKIDCIVIAGMGGIEISKILSQGDKANTYILVPHQDDIYLRKFLKNNEFYVLKDFIIEDKRFYTVIVATKGINNYTQDEIFLGKNYPKSEIYDKRNNFRINKIENIIKGMGVLNGENLLNAEMKEEREVLIKHYGADCTKSL